MRRNFNLPDNPRRRGKKISCNRISCKTISYKDQLQNQLQDQLKVENALENIIRSIKKLKRDVEKKDEQCVVKNIE